MASSEGGGGRRVERGTRGQCEWGHFTSILYSESLIP